MYYYIPDKLREELIQNANHELKTRLYALIRKLWRDEKMPDDRKIRLIVPLFKKRRQNEV